MLLKWIFILLMMVLFTAILGFTGITVPPIRSIVRILFVILLVVFVLIVFIHICSDKEE